MGAITALKTVLPKQEFDALTTKLLHIEQEGIDPVLQALLTVTEKAWLCNPLMRFSYNTKEESGQRVWLHVGNGKIEYHRDECRTIEISLDYVHITTPQFTYTETDVYLIGEQVRPIYAPDRMWATFTRTTNNSYEVTSVNDPRHTQQIEDNMLIVLSAFIQGIQSPQAQCQEY